MKITNIRRPLARALPVAVGVALAAVATLAQAADTIKVGVLHSLSGTMAISETTLKDTVLMLIDEQNKKGGVLGKKLEAGRRRPGLELAAVRRKGRGAAGEGQGLGGIRLLDLGVAQIGAAGVREGQWPAVLPGAVRG